MLTEKQIEFCQAIACGQNGAQAYATAFKNDNMNTSSAKASRLLKLPDIMDKINEIKSLNRQIVAEAHTQSIRNLVLPHIASAAQRMGFLTQIMMGEVSINKTIICKGEPVVIEVWPSFTDRIHAVGALNIMDGSYVNLQTAMNENTKFLVNIKPEQEDAQESFGAPAIGKGGV